MVITRMEKPSVSLLNAVNNADFPTASDLHEDFVLAEPGQTFKVFVSLKRPSIISWPEGSTHLHVAGRLDGGFHMHSIFISRQNLAAFLAHAEDTPDEVQVILDGLLEQNVVYSERRRPSFGKAVVQLQQTDPTSWTSQAGLVEVEVAAGKLVQLPGRKLAKSEPATVKCGEECKSFNTPALRVVPSVAVCHSEATPKPHDQQGQQATAAGVTKVSESSVVIPCPAKQSFSNTASLALQVVPNVQVCHSAATPKPEQGQQETAGVAKVSETFTAMPQAANQFGIESFSKSASAALQAAHSPEVANLDKRRRATAGGEAKFSESSIVMPRPANHSFSKSASLASVKVKYDSKEHVNLRRTHTEKTLADGYKFAGQQWKRPRRSAELNRPANKSYKEVYTLGVAST
jgi:hypothetical protein